MQRGKLMTGSGAKRFPVSGEANRKPIRILPAGRAMAGVVSLWRCDLNLLCKRQWVFSCANWRRPRPANIFTGQTNCMSQCWR